MKANHLLTKLALLTGLYASFTVNAQPAGYVYVDPDPVLTMVVHQIDTIIIDGIADAAYPAPFALENFITYTGGEFTGQSDHFVKVQIGWREEGLYIFFDITDDIDKGALLDWGLDGVELKINPDTSNDGEYFEWKDDAIEIGIVRDITDQYRYHIVDIDGEGTEGNGPGDNGEIVAIGPRTGLPGVSFAIINNTGSYTVEALIPWLFFLPLGTTEEEIPAWREKTMGFDIHCADNDQTNTNDGRDHAIIWDPDGDPSSTEADMANKNTSLLGQITFGEPLGTKDMKQEQCPSVYPNPAGSVVNIGNLQDARSLEIINLLGQRELILYPESSEIKVDIPDLEYGIYLVKVIHDDGHVSMSKLLVK